MSCYSDDVTESIDGPLACFCGLKAQPGELHSLVACVGPDDRIARAVAERYQKPPSGITTIKTQGLVCSGDDACRVPSHWQDAEYSGPHRDPAAVAAMALNEPCCEHCACGTPQGWPERLGHDDTCRYGCNDVPLRDAASEVTP
ncbi:MAG: hypothetical protein NVS3B1_06350 [Marmoricola sp.]